MTLPIPRPEVASLPSYVPGARGNADAVPPIKLSSNENPFAPLAVVTEAVAAAGERTNRYPDMAVSALSQAIAEFAGVGVESVVTGSGSVGVLTHTLQAFAGVGDEVVFAWRSFEAYPILTQLTGATSVMVPVDAEGRHDLVAMAAAVTERTKVVMVCSPNNPTGTAVGAAEFEAFMQAVPAHVLVILDEAYIEFGRDETAVSGAELFGRWGNLMVLRTFSKAYGLAGLRVGYGLAEPSIAGAILACVMPFSVSEAAQVAAIAALENADGLTPLIDELVSERGRVVAAVREQGWSVPQAEGNFFWLPVADKAAELAAFLGQWEPRPILVRPFVGFGVRVTIGAPAENDELISALAAWPQKV